MKQQLEIVKQAREIIREITMNDLRSGVLWLTHVRYAAGTLDTAISILEKEIMKDETQQTKTEDTVDA